MCVMSVFVVLAAVFAGVIIGLGIARRRGSCCQGGKTPDKPPFRTEDVLNTYDKPLDDKTSHVDFDDAD